MNKIIGLSEEDARKYYLELIPVFLRFINNDPSIVSYCDPFNWNDVDKIHDNTLKENEKELIYGAAREERKEKLANIKNILGVIKRRDITEVEQLRDELAELIDPKYSSIDIPTYDYYFRDGDIFYSLDISHNFDGFGYNHDFYEQTYPDQIDNLYCCELNSHHEYIEPSDVKTSITFTYNAKTNEVIELLGVSYHSALNKNIVRVNDDEVVLKKVLSNK